uniref:Zn(2)-C6 fungal-type domain-containing protein n=1 Tax=Bionectria ochroleuca TaxID=29856 RepID=A0A0B7KIT9_BIOOC
MGVIEPCRLHCYIEPTQRYHLVIRSHFAMSSSQRGACGNPHGSKRPRAGERTMLACTHCKHKKLKCDAQSPKCHNCVRTGKECLVEDPATGLHRPRDYMQSLKSRVAYLESLLQQVRPDVAVDHYPYAPSDNPPPPATTTAGQHHRAGSQEPEQEVDGLSSDVALLCLSAAGREPHYFGPSSALSFSRISGNEGNVRLGVVRERLDGRRSPTVRFPPPDLAEGLVNLGSFYF